jgi:hypothetical protein
MVTVAEMAKMMRCTLPGYNVNGVSMMPLRVGSELVSIVLVCLLAIFFFPGGQGPYSAVHGPVTALQAARAAARLRIDILQAALIYFRNCVASPLLMFCGITYSHAELPPMNLVDCSTILRC